MKAATDNSHWCSAYLVYREQHAAYMRTGLEFVEELQHLQQPHAYVTGVVSVQLYSTFHVWYDMSSISAELARRTFLRADQVPAAV